MQTKDGLTRIMAIAGTLLCGLPLLTPVIFSLIRLIAMRRFTFDYLLPMEFFPLVLAGGGLLVWAAYRGHTRLKLVGWSYAVAIAMLFGSQALAVATGLASGETEAAGLPWLLLLAAMGTYILAVLALTIGGVQLIKDLFKPAAA